MTKSRKARPALLPAVIALAAAMPAPAKAGDPTVWARPEEALDAIGAARAEAAFDSPVAQAARAARCNSGRPDDDVVVCGRRASGGGLRVPYEPEPGAHIRLVAGEAPSAVAALGASTCVRLCYQPVMVNVLEVARTIERGLDRLLHPD